MNASTSGQRVFQPSSRQIHLLLVVGFLSVGYAIYLRYLALEYSQVSLACQAGLNTWLCRVFHIVIALFQNAVFGWVALIAAALHLLRPSIVLCTIALAAAGFGVVLHNAGLAGLAVGLLILSLARRAPAPEVP